MTTDFSRKLTIKRELLLLKKHAEHFSDSGEQVIGHFKYMQKMVELIFKDVQETQYESLKEYAIFLYRSGIQKKSICKILNINIKQLNLYLDICVRKSYVQNYRDKYKFIDILIELYLKGVTQTDLARKFNLGDATIISILKREGVHEPYRNSPQNPSKVVSKAINTILKTEETPEIKPIIKPIKKPVINKINNTLYKRLEYEWID